MPFPINENVNVQRGNLGQVEHLEHFQQPFLGVPDNATVAVAAADGVPAAVTQNAEALARAYLQEVAPIYGFKASELPDTGVAAAAAAANLDAPQGSKLLLAEQKEVFNTTTISYQQFFNGIPVWESGTSVTVQDLPMRVTASRSSVHSDVRLDSAANQLAEAKFAPDGITEEVAREVLSLPADYPLTINRGPAGELKRYVYQYDPAKRLDPAAQNPADKALEGGVPTLLLPPVPDSIAPGGHYVVTELLFTLAGPDHGNLNWRAFVEEQTGAVLYLRALVACASGHIYRSDPFTAGGPSTATPNAAATVLNAFRSTVQLQGLIASNPQRLSGNYVKVVDNDPPSINPPVATSPPADFSYDVPTREFAAVNAYHHCDELFRRMEVMGFSIATYFDGTRFPVDVDACAFSDALNARAPGNVTGTGSGGFQFGLAGGAFPCASIAADVRVVLHEFGHTLLWDSVHSPNFGFAHSAGDALAAILLDPESAATDRFATFPWLLPNRRHDRAVSAGWGWDGSRYNPFGSIDPAGYLAEQILSTTLFRLYRSMGGDNTSSVAERQLAARRAVYLIFRAIGILGAGVTPTPRPEIFATALMNADIGTQDFEGYIGGALHKVIRWSFEKQGLYQRPGTPRPITREGAPPPVDLFINDGRNGEYAFAATSTPEIWNRLSATPGTGPGSHEAPVTGSTNYLYVRIRNRGAQGATNVVVRGYQGNPATGVGLMWPQGWTPLTTPQISVPGTVTSGTPVDVGPFEWTPGGVDAILMEVSASGDLSNIDPRTFFPCASNVGTHIDQLVPFDNNLAMLNLTGA